MHELGLLPDSCAKEGQVVQPVAEPLLQLPQRGLQAEHNDELGLGKYLAAQTQLEGDSPFNTALFQHALQAADPPLEHSLQVK